MSTRNNVSIVWRLLGGLIFGLIAGFTLYVLLGAHWKFVFMMVMLVTVMNLLLEKKFEEESALKRFCSFLSPSA